MNNLYICVKQTFIIRIMDTKMYKCQYCHEEYKPTRRYVQIYCSDTCRSKAYHQREKLKKQLGTVEKLDDSSNTKEKKLSVFEMANAAMGAAAAAALKDFFTKEENKPATKADLLAFTKQMKRYYEINNLQKRQEGAVPPIDLSDKFK